MMQRKQIILLGFILLGAYAQHDADKKVREVRRCHEQAAQLGKDCSVATTPANFSSGF